MIEFLLAFVGILVIFASLGACVILSRKPISGSCGGLAQLSDESHCTICGRDAQAASACGENRIVAGQLPGNNACGRMIDDR